MNKSTKIIIGSGVAAFVGIGAIAGISYADRPHHGGFGKKQFAMPMVMGFHDMRNHLYGIVDTNGDDKLTQAEIDAAHADRRAKYDRNKDSNLSLEEFDGLWGELTQPLKIRAFQFLDTNGDAKISKSEIDGRLSKLVKRFDRNGDGALSMDDRRRHYWSRHHDDDDDDKK